MSDAGDLLYEHDGGIARVTLNRPESANAITPEQRDRLIGLLGDASSDAAVRVVVRTGAGKHFCSGADLRASPRLESPTVGDVARTIRRGAQRLITSILDCEKPIIAAVNGTAAGIGAHIAFACDLMVAADTARFIEVFVRRGITPDGAGAYLLPRLIGLAKAKELVLLGDDLSAVDAERIGLINKVVPALELAKAADDWAQRLAAGPTKAISLSKWLLNRSLDSDRAGALDDEAWAQELASRTDDFDEGVQAFVDRRDAEFKGC